MYGDQFGEFVCGYWGLKGQHTVNCHLVSLGCISELNKMVAKPLPKIMASQQTMPGQNGDLTGQRLHWPVMLTLGVDRS